jgi:hypothetical protein
MALSFFAAHTTKAETADLPLVKGYRDIPALQVAATADGALSSLLEGLRAKTFEDVLDPGQDIEGLIEKFVFRWFGVEGMVPDSRGPNIDARQLGVLERIRGRRFVQTGAGGEKNPLFWAAMNILDGYQILFKNYFALMAGQTMAADLFIGNIRYDHRGDGGVWGTTGLNRERVTQAMKTIQTMEDDDVKYRLWRRLYIIINGVHGIDRLPSEDQAYLFSAVRLSGIDWATLKEKSNYIHVSEAPGSSYADRVLGMVSTDCNIMPLYTEARKRSDARQVVMSNLMTGLFKRCGDDSKSVIEAFKKNGFSVHDVSKQDNQKSIFGDRKPYDGVYYATKVTKMNKIRKLLFLPFDAYYASIFVRGDTVEHVTAYIQRPNIN